MNIAAAVAVSTASIATGAPPGEGDGEVAPESSPLTMLGRNPGAFEPAGNGPNGADVGPDVVRPLEDL